MPKLSKISPCLWYENQAEAAAQLYISIFGGDSGIDHVSHYGKEGFEIHGQPEGMVMAVAFHFHGQSFTALNGGPQFKFNEAISLQIACDSQAEVDHCWNEFTREGSEGPCGWLKDKFGLSWQVVPTRLLDMLTDGDPQKVARVTAAYLQMTKFDLSALERAYAGK